MRALPSSLRHAGLLFVASLGPWACADGAEPPAGSEERLEIQGALLDAPLGEAPAVEAASQLAPRIEPRVEPPADASEEDSPGDSLLGSDPYGRGAETGSVDERDAQAAAALGPEVLAMREEAKALAREIAASGDEGEFAYIDFERLVFEGYQPPEYRENSRVPLGPDSFPKEIQALDGRKVQLAGFMIAVDFKDKQVEDFMLCRFPPGCCFGGIPLFDEWVDCTPTYAEKRDWSPFEMILVDGTLEVGEVMDEDGFALSIYRMRVEDIRPFE